jgi:flagellar basal body P-ring formation protein FlgA
MIMKTHRVLTIALMAGWLIQAGQAPAGDKKSASSLQIYLPRTITLEQSTLKLGDVSVIRGDPGLSKTASQILLGRIFVPNQRVVVNRNTVLSRLATHGIPGSQVVLTGAKQVVVQRSSQTIKGTDLVDMAQDFLHKHYACSSEFVATRVRTPKDILIEQRATNIQLVPRLIRGTSHGSVKVQITVTSGIKKVAQQDVTFRLQYQCRSAVATQDIARGTVIGQDNVKIEKQLSHRPQSASWKAPWGLIAQRPIPINSKIQTSMVSAPVEPLSLKRNDMVVIRIERPGFVITATGQALADARSGSIVKIKNTDSNRIILCKVRDGGTVEPVF